MKTKGKNLSILFTCITLMLIFFAGCASVADKKGRKEISDGERALGMMTVQSVFSKHAFYHQASKHCEEIADIWVAEDGPNAETARWILNASEVLQGIDAIKERYCTQHVEGLKSTLEALSKKVPSVENIPENISAGAEYVMHTQETPVIEVAGDGKTAKMLCYSIGLSVQGSIDESGNTSTRSNWMWEKYAVDFVKEDGEWKIWHLVNVHDEGPSESGSQGQGGMPGGQGGMPGGDMAQGGMPPQGGMPDGAGGQDMAQGGAPPSGQGGMPGGQGGAPGGQASGSSDIPDYFRYSPTEPLRIDPPFPEPYYTFSETFSY